MESVGNNEKIFKEYKEKALKLKRNNEYKNRQKRK